MDNYITIKTGKHTELSELDFDMHDEIIGDYNEDYPTEIDLGERPYADGPPINIDRVLKLLQEYKEAGHNYVSMDYHIDHIGYIFNPQKVYKSTDEEIKDYQELQSRRKKVNEKEVQLLSELKKLRNEEE